MNAPPILPEQIPSPEKALHRLFLTLFLRGRSARGLKKSSAPRSVGQKLALTLLIYAGVGCMALLFSNQPIFALSIYMHSMTFAFLGMFVAASAGEILFNKEEADILMHRPVSPRMMLWAKIRVLVEVSLWMAGALNLMCLAVGAFSSHGNWLYPLAHVVSTMMEALFGTGSVVLVYQLCLRWFGRERLEGLMTTSQMVVGIGAVLCGQILPRVIIRLNGVLDVSEGSWWIGLLPPAWFAGFDDALAGSGLARSWLFAGIAVGVTALVLWLAFVRLANTYETGLQTLNETVSKRKKSGGRRWLSTLVQVPPLSWWLRDPVSRASFLLITAYMVRDRDVKLRLYPGLAPMLVFPFLFMFQHYGKGDNGFGVALSGAYVGLIPLMALNLLQYSQQWQAADVFRVAPLTGPARIFHGARRAVLLFLTIPLLLLFGMLAVLLQHDRSILFMLLPGIVALPVYAIVPGWIGKSLPLSLPTEAAKSAGRGLVVIPVMLVAVGLGFLAHLAWEKGLFWWFMLAEVVVAGGIYALLRAAIGKVRWASED